MVDARADVPVVWKDTASYSKAYCECVQGRRIAQGGFYANFAYTTRHGAITGKTQTKEVGLYNLDVIISVGYRVKSIQGTRFRQWATRVLREMLLNKLEEIKRISNLERRMDAAEGDIKQIKGGMSYLVQQLSAPPDPPRRRIGFGNDAETPTKPYGKA